MTEPGQQEATSSTNFDAQKRHYFFQLGLHVRDALKLHMLPLEAQENKLQGGGLWKRNSEGKRDWKNVSEHCLVEVARAIAFSELLQLPSDIQEDLMTAAALHDFYKRGETELVKKQGKTWENFAQATEESNKRMREAGFSERVIRIANAVGHGSFLETERILAKDSFSDEDIAHLILHYIDAYSDGSNWVEVAKEENGASINQLDQKVKKNESRYQGITFDEEGKAAFNDQTIFQVQRNLGHRVESTLVRLIQQKSATTKPKIREPILLPEAIDEIIKSKIQSP